METWSWNQPALQLPEGGLDDRLDAGAARSEGEADGRGGDGENQPPARRRVAERTPSHSWLLHRIGDFIASSYCDTLQHEQRVFKLSSNRSESRMTHRLPRVNESGRLACRNRDGRSRAVAVCRQRGGAGRARFCLRPRQRSLSRHAGPHLPARTHAHLSLLLQSRAAGRLQLLFRLRPLREGRHREPGASSGGNIRRISSGLRA